MMMNEITDSFCCFDAVVSSFWFWDRYRSQFHGGIIHIHPVWNEWRGTEKTEGKYLKFRWGRIHMRWTLLCSLVAMATSLISTSYVNSWLISHTLWNVHSSSSIALNIHSSFLSFGFWVLGFGFWVLGFGFLVTWLKVTCRTSCADSKARHVSLCKQISMYFTRLWNELIARNFGRVLGLCSLFKHPLLPHFSRRRFQSNYAAIIFLLLNSPAAKWKITETIRWQPTVGSLKWQNKSRTEIWIAEPLMFEINTYRWRGW